MRVIALLLATLLAAPVAMTPAQSQDVPEITRAKTLLDKAAKALASARSGDDQLAALGKAVTAHEIALSAYRAGLRTLSQAQATAGAQLAEDRVRLESLTAALQSIGQAPNSALIAYPAGPVAAARAAALMAEIMPVINQRLDAIRLHATDVKRLHAQQDAARIEIRGALGALQDLRTTTMEAVRRKRLRDMPGRSELAAQAKAAARQAKTLTALTKALKAAGSDAKPAVSFTEARGLIPLPGAGSMIAGFGEPDPWGRPGQGMTLELPAYAQISAPWDGTVRFSGPLIDYGQVVVLEPEAGILIVIAGLARVDRIVGETVLAGERLGDLGGAIPAGEDFLLEASKDRDEIGTEKLYIELRQNGAAIDPAPWFDMTRKGSGG